MGDDHDSIKVTLTLRRPIAERLRAMCHARDETASDIIDRWILAHDWRGDPIAAPKTVEERRLDAFLDAFAGRRR